MRFASMIFLISYVGIGVMYFLGFIFTPTVQNAGAFFVFTVLAWPYFSCIGLFAVNLPIVAFMTFVAILVSLVIQARLLRDQSKEISPLDASRVNNRQNRRLTLILWLQGFLVLAIVVAPLERTFWPVSLLMWASTCLPLAVWAINSRRIKSASQKH